jgi:uncharacterized membrane-anchored protein
MNSIKLSKVAEVTILFWIMKIIATTLGETLGDYLSMTLNLGYLSGIIITLIFFLCVLVIQLMTKKYNPTIFWLVIIATTTLGTEISDFMDRTLGLGYTFGSLLLFVGLLGTLFRWYKKYKSINVEPITERPQEIYYWVAILFSNSLGTAFGDYLTDVLNLTYVQGALITAGIIVVIVILHYRTTLNHVLLFWIAFIFTRPFGATFGDFLTKPVADGGLELGTLSATIMAITLMIASISLEHFKLKNQQDEN